MISLDPEPNPFQSLRNSLAMDNNNSNRATEEDDEDDNNSYQPSWAHTPPQIDEQSATSSTTTRAKNPYQKSSLQVRWLILTLTCIVMTGSYYAYDIPSALHQQLQDYMSPSTDDSNSYETNFNLLYTIYSIPNVILPLFGGNIVDRYGAPKCLTFFATLVFMGASLLSIGVSNQSWHTMYLGRFIFGLGAESLCVAQSTIVSDWFEGKEVAFAMGIGLSISRLGSIFNNMISPKVANTNSIASAFRIGALLTFGSCVMAVIIVLVEKRAMRTLKRSEVLDSLNMALLENEVVVGRDGDDDVRVEEEGEAGEILPYSYFNGNNNSSSNEHQHQSTTKPCTAGAETGVHISDVRKFGPLFWLLTISCFVVYGCVLPFNNVASGILLERNFFVSSPDDCHLEHAKECTMGYLLQNGTTNNALDDTSGESCWISPTQAPVLPSSINHTSSDSAKSSEWEESSYIYSTLTSKNVDCGDLFWSDACTSNYCSKQDAATEHAGRVMSIPYLISAMSSPPLGHLVDRIGRRAQIAVVSSSLLFLVHLTLATSASSPIGPMIGQGVAYSLYAAVLWPSVPLTVQKQYTGTAFGMITSIQNIGLAIFPLIIAAIYNASGRYIPNVEFFFAACAFAGIVVGVFMNRLDKRYGGMLNRASSDGEDEEVVVFDDGVRNDGSGDFAGVEEDEYYSPLLTS